MGVEKRIEFNEEVQMKEFDSNRPVSTGEAKRVRNFIQHNKKRIRSRSKNNGAGVGKNLSDINLSNKKTSPNSIQLQSLNGVNVAQSLKKRSAIKNLKDLVSEDFEFYEAEDIAI
jgi:hypothetical protein